MFGVTYFYPKGHSMTSYTVRRTDELRKTAEPLKTINLTMTCAHKPPQFDQLKKHANDPSI